MQSKIIERFERAVQANGPRTRDDITEREYAAAKSALEAALSGTEPVAARYDFDGCGFQYIDNGSGSDWKTRHPDAEMLYSAPPAPSVAVKAQNHEVADFLYKHGALTLGAASKAVHLLADNGFCFTKKSDAALSAQVQDVAIPEGWQIVPKEPTEEIISKLTLIIRQSAWGRNNVVHQWAQLLAAAPAKQEGGE